MKSILFVFVLALAISCGREEEDLTQAPTPTNPTTLNEADLVIKGTIEIPVIVGAKGIRMAGASVTQPVKVTVAPDTTLVLDNSKFVTPPMASALLDFGNLIISDLKDNNLKVCGASGKEKCGTAILRMYTTGVAGAGLYNAADAWGAPMTASLTTPQSVGLDVAGAAVMQTYSIGANMRILKLKDLPTAPNYNIRFDFTDAGAGDYSTTIVIEYALAP